MIAQHLLRAIRATTRSCRRSRSFHAGFHIPEDGRHVLSRRIGAQEVLRDHWVLRRGRRIAAVDTRQAVRH